MALTLFSPLGSFYRYAVVERRVAWPVGISFGVGIFIGSIWLGKYVTAFLPMQAYKEWLAILVVLMGIQTLRELSPKAMEKRKAIKAMVKKFNEEVAKAKAGGPGRRDGQDRTGQVQPDRLSLQVLGRGILDQPVAVRSPGPGPSALFPGPSVSAAASCWCRP